MNTAAIAQHLNIAAEAIVKIEEWATVLWVRFKCGCRFVSKKIMKTKTDIEKLEEVEQKKQPKPRQSFQQKLDAIYKNKELLQKRHNFCMEIIALMTSRKQYRDRVDGYQVKKTKSGYSITLNGMDLGLNGMSANTAYGWCVRNPLNHWVRFAESVRIEYYDQYGI